MPFFRTFGLLVGGAAALLVAFLLLLLFPAPTVTAFGWTAYAPLEALSPLAGFWNLTIVSVILAFAGVVAITADIALRAGRARQAREDPGA